MNEHVMWRSVNQEQRLTDGVAAPVEQDDTYLVHASQQGDQEAFALLVQRHQRRIYHLSWRMLQDEDDASESTQEAFVAAWQGLPSFRGEARFSTWLYRIAYHCCLRQLEVRKREQAVQAVLYTEQVLATSNQEQQAEQLFERQEQLVSVREQMMHLPGKYRMVLILRHVQDRTYEEIAERLSLPVGTIKTHLFRARALLKERLLAQHPRGAAAGRES
jgi:RNA polymerase sigma-70 factor, ECF subfamily